MAVDLYADYLLRNIRILLEDSQNKLNLINSKFHF